MLDNNTIRRALAGDEEAQLECTDAEYVLPCPFCMSSASLFYCTTMEGWAVTCENGDCDVDGGYHELPYEAIEHWNRRARVPEEDA